MKTKIKLLLIIAVLLWVNAAFAETAHDIIYVNQSNGRLYIKSSGDTSNGDQMSSTDWVWWFNWVVDSTKTYFFYSYWDGTIWKRTISGTSNGSQINSQWSTNFVLNSDNSKLYYSWSGDYSIIVKNTNDTSNWTTLSWSIKWFPRYLSYDGNYIFYSATSDWWYKLYKKNLNDSWTWTLVINDYVGRWKMSNNERYFYYINWNQSNKIYVKDLQDWNTTPGTQLTTFWVNYFDLSLDNLYIFYNNASDWNKMYKKNINDWSTGSAITSVWVYSIYSSGKEYQVASCLDWIQNQDETGIDIGGVCGTCDDWIQQTEVTNPEIAIDYGWRCTTSSEYRFDWCKQRDIYYWSGMTSVYTMSGLTNTSLTVSDISSESEWLKIFWLWQSKIEQWTFDDWSGINYDMFKVYNIQYSDATAEQNNPQVKSGSLLVASWWPVSSIKTDTTTGKAPSIEIYSMRSGAVRKFNKIQFTGASYPTITKGSQTNYIGSVTWETTNGIVSSNLVLSGGVASAYLSDWYLATAAVVNLQQMNSKFAWVSFNFSWFSFGVNDTKLSVTECGNGDFKCKMYVESPTASPVCKPDSNSTLWIGEACVYTTAFTTPVVINDAWDITTVSGNACIPNRKQGTIVTPDGFKVDYVVDQSGAVIQQNTRPIATWDFTEQCLTSDPWILEYVKCSFQFVWNKIKQLTTTTDKTTDIINKAQTWVKPNDTKTWSIELWQSGKQNTNNWLVNAVQNQYDAYDNGTDAFANVWTMMKWTLGAILTFVVILLFFALSRNRKQ